MIKSNTINPFESQAKSRGTMHYAISKEIKKSEQVTLSETKAVYNNGKVTISWKTVTHGEDFIFIVERSDDGKAFEIMGICRCGFETKGEAVFCQQIDEKPQINFPYYRVIYIEKSSAVFGNICEIENIDTMLMEKAENSLMLSNEMKQYIQ